LIIAVALTNLQKIAYNTKIKTRLHYKTVNLNFHCNDFLLKYLYLSTFGEYLWHLMFSLSGEELRWC